MLNGIKKRFSYGLSIYFTLVILISPLMAQEDIHVFQNAVLEGIQLSSEPASEPGEKLVTCYFIFRDKPTSFFYEIRPKEKKLVFEFNDTEKGASPIVPSKEPPITGYSVEQKRIDINKEVRGLKPEWHDLITVTFTLDAVPKITVNEEYSVVSFSYKWATNPEDADKYTVKDRSGLPIIASLAGLAGLGGGILAWWLVQDGNGGEDAQPLSIDDLPVRSTE